MLNNNQLTQPNVLPPMAEIYGNVPDRPSRWGKIFEKPMERTSGYMLNSREATSS